MARCCLCSCQALGSLPVSTTSCIPFGCLPSNRLSSGGNHPSEYAFGFPTNAGWPPSEGVGADGPEDKLIGVAAAVAGAVHEWTVRSIADQTLITTDQVDTDCFRHIVGADRCEAELLYAAIGVVSL